MLALKVLYVRCPRTKSKHQEYEFSKTVKNLQLLPMMIKQGILTLMHKTLMSTLTNHPINIKDE